MTSPYFSDPPSLRLRSRASRADGRVQLVELESAPTQTPTSAIATSDDSRLTLPVVSSGSLKRRSEPVTPVRKSARRSAQTESSSPSVKRIKLEDGRSPSPDRPVASSFTDDIEDLLPVSPSSSSTKLLLPPSSLTTAIKTENDERKPPTPKKQTPIKLRLDRPHPAPARWERQYELISRMREKIVAPVDTLGCDTPNGERSTDPKTIRFHILISLMLSSQTKDPVTSQAVTNLHNTLLPTDPLGLGLTARTLADASIETIEGCINKVGFWRRKAEYIKSTAERIVDPDEDLDEGEEEGGVGVEDGEVKVEAEKEEGDIPRTLGGLCKLKGVGPKMAFLALQCAWNINAGVGVDVHVHRITNRLGWHKPKTMEPEQTRLNLQSWLPPRLFKPINHVLVGFGQVVCLPVGPRCDVCTLGKERVCPSRVANVNVKGRKVVEFGFIDKEEDAGSQNDTLVGGRPAMAKVEIEFGTDDEEPQRIVEMAMAEIAEERGQTVVKAEPVELTD